VRLLPAQAGAETRLPAAQPARLRRLGLPSLLSIPLLLFFVIPVIALIGRTTPAALLANVGRPQVAQAIWLSLRTTLAATALAVVFGAPVGYLLARRRFPGWRLLDTLVDLPTVLPPSVAGVALLVAFGRQGLVGGWLAGLGISVAFTPLAVVLAQLFVAAPLFVRAASIGFAGIDRELEQAAAIDGASRAQNFRFITLPLAYSAMLSGAVLTWARALGEFGATILFAGNFPGRTQTMPLAIYIGFETDLDLAITLSVILIGTSFLVLVLVKLMLQRNTAT
jgi:molybdate transport system permease protein